jgi:hypothetical protein
MDNITKSIVFDLLKAGNCIDMVSYELGIPSLDIQDLMSKHQQQKTSNILAEQLASRLPALLELSCKQLEKVLLNENTDRRLRVASIIVKAATVISRIKP